MLVRALLAPLLLAAVLAAQSAPSHVWFTWTGDTGTTLCVNFMTRGEKAIEPRVWWDTQPRAARVAEYRNQATGSRMRIEGLADRWIHRVELKDLVPGSRIHLVAGDPVHGISREHVVRTIPHDGSPLRFVTGGDMGPGAETRHLLREAARLDPDFAIVGGDIAYADGNLANVGRWDTWFEYWQDEMVTRDGRSVPMVLAIGNHEVRGSFLKTEKEAPFWYGFFPQGGSSYFVRRFGSNLATWILDTSHTAPHEGAQTQWLDVTLGEHAVVPHKIAVYHVPFWPSHRDSEDTYSVAGRKHWMPLFEKHGIDLAFENHDDTFKRTHPLRDGKVDPNGIVYLGDGCFGRPPRGVAYGGRWYLARQGSVLHFWSVEVDAQGIVARAVDDRGKVFDMHPESHPEFIGIACELGERPVLYTMPKDSLGASELNVSGPEWNGGTFEFRFTNRFAHTVQFSATVDELPDGVSAVADQLNAVPDGDRPAAVRPGADLLFRVTLTATKPVPADKVKARVRYEVLFNERPPGRSAKANANQSVPVKKGS